MLIHIAKIVAEGHKRYIYIFRPGENLQAKSWLLASQQEETSHKSYSRKDCKGVGSRSLGKERLVGFHPFSDYKSQNAMRLRRSNESVGPRSRVCVRRTSGHLSPRLLLRSLPRPPFCARGYGPAASRRLYGRVCRGSTNGKRHLGGKPRPYPQGGGTCHEVLVASERKLPRRANERGGTKDSSQ